ncbi:MAG: hypothetical protein WCO21_03020 [bacterium]
MKVIVVGQNAGAIIPLVKEHGFKIVEKKPDFIVSYGGDGTLMISESLYPGIPKIILKGSLICKKASPFPNEEVLKRISKGKFEIEKVWKLEARANGKMLLGLNDIVVHNTDMRHAMRYTTSIDGVQMVNSIIGDGVVVATPFGSTGYYRSITDSFFEVGIGLAFNNSTEQSDHIILKENRTISVHISRGPAVVYADNQDDSILLNVGDSITIRKSKQFAKIVRPK